MRKRESVCVNEASSYGSRWGRRGGDIVLTAAYATKLRQQRCSIITAQK